VADPAPSFALTTSSPPNCTRVVRARSVSSGMLTGGFAWLNNGMIVLPEWPPKTGIVMSAGDPEVISAVNVDARTTSSVVTPKSFLGLNTLWDLRTSATMGTVELTGLEMTRINAFGQYVAIPFERSRTIPALILNKSEN
jgi:hypothetical protein